MASDFELIIGKLNIFSHLVGAKKAQQQKPKDQQAAFQEVPQLTHEKKINKSLSKKQIVIIEEEEDQLVPSSEDEPEEDRQVAFQEEEEEEPEKPPRRYTKKTWY